MPKKFEISATEEQIDNLVKALALGSPMSVALSYAKISTTTYYYWLTIAGIVHKVKSDEELYDQERIIDSGIDVEKVKDAVQAAADQEHMKTAPYTFPEPNRESILRYKNSRTFQKFADDCYAIIQRCNMARSEVILDALMSLRKAQKDKRINPSVSFWLLEKTLPGTFGKAVGGINPDANETANIPVTPIEVKFVSPNLNDAEERMRKMEKELDEAINGKVS